MQDRSVTVPDYWTKAPCFCTNNTCPMKKYCLLKRRNFDAKFKDVRYETYILNHFNHWKSGGGFNCSALTRHKYITIGDLKLLERWGYFINHEDFVKIKSWSSKNG